MSGSHTTRFAPERTFVLDTLRLGHDRPMMHGLLEIDVTRARARLAERKAEGRALSFTAFVAACVGRAVAAHPEVHALPDWRGRRVIFDDVDITTLVEVRVEGRPFAYAHVLRATQRRPVEELHEEVRAVAARGLDALGRSRRRWMHLLTWIPGPFRRAFLRLFLLSPYRMKQNTGTVLLSSVGMFGGGVGWGFSAPGLHRLSLVVGGIAPRPGQGEVLCLTVSADHEIVDGAPLARFIQDLRARLEGAEGL